MASCRNCIHSGFCYLTIRDEGSPCEFVDKRNMVEVVRCKDCIHYEYGKGYAPWCNHMCGLDEMGEDDYCSYGERNPT